MWRAAIWLLSAIEQKVSIWLIWQRAVLLLLLYIAIWSGIAVGLQEEARLNNWNSDALLVIGNSASNRFTSAWKGRVFELEIWDRAVSAEVARKPVSRDLADPPADDSIAEYRFLGSPPFQDERHLLPDLSWAPGMLVSARPKGAFFGGTSWLITPGAVTTLVSDLEKTGQFSLRVLCEPAVIGGVDARIASISSPSGDANMELSQENAGLVFWFRTPLTVQRSRMSWMIPETFAANEMRDILLSFDGTKLGLFVDGKKYGGSYELGPAAALAKLIRRIKTPELEGYQYVFYALVFFPAGCLIGLVWSSMPTHRIGRIPLLLLGLILSAVIFEAVLAHMTGRAVSPGNISLSILFAASGSLWINLREFSVPSPRVRDPSAVGIVATSFDGKMEFWNCRVVGGAVRGTLCSNAS